MKIKKLIKKYLPRTLFGRSLMIILVPALLLQIITTIVFFDRHWDEMTRRLTNALAGEVGIIAQRLEDDSRPESIRKIIAFAAQSLDLLVSFEKGAEYNKQDLVVSHKNSFLIENLQDSLKDKVGRPYRIQIDAREKWIRIGVQLENGILEVSAPQKRLFSSSGYVFLLWMIFTTLILFAIAIIFMRNQIRPIRRLAVAAERFGKGRDMPAFKPEGAKEVRQAASAFLNMHERVKRQVAQRTTMLASISHDLRTPLTRIRLQLAMLEPSPELEDLKNDVSEMQRMIDGYLAFARGEGGEEISRADVSAILYKIQMDLKKQGKTVHASLPDKLTLPVRRQAFERCLNNLANNAARHADQIWLSAMHYAERVQIVIEDDGPGIPEEAFEAVFRPFHRLDESRSSDKGGVGLGLPIAKDIIMSHGGKIWLEASNRGGLRVVVDLPE